MTLNKTRRFLVCVVALLLTLTVATNWFVSIVTPARAVVTEALLGSYTIVACLLGRMGVFAVNDMSEAESISISRRVYNLFPDTERQLIDSHIPELGFVGQEITFARYEFNTLANKIKSIFGDGNYVETYTPVDPVYISTEQTPILFKDFISPGINVVRDAQVTDNTSVINLVNPKYIFYSDIAVNESFITEFDNFVFSSKRISSSKPYYSVRVSLSNGNYILYNTSVGYNDYAHTIYSPVIVNDEFRIIGSSNNHPNVTLSPDAIYNSSGTMIYNLSFYSDGNVSAVNISTNEVISEGVFTSPASYIWALLSGSALLSSFIGVTVTDGVEIGIDGNTFDDADNPDKVDPVIISVPSSVGAPYVDARPTTADPDPGSGDNDQRKGDLFHIIGNVTVFLDNFLAEVASFFLFLSDVWQLVPLPVRVFFVSCFGIVLTGGIVQKLLGG